MAKSKAKFLGKDSKVTLQIKGEPAISQGRNKYYQGVEPKKSKPEKITKPGKVINRLPHDVTLSYDAGVIIIPPRGREKVANFEKLGALPRGVMLVPLKK